MTTKVSFGLMVARIGSRDDFGFVSISRKVKLDPSNLWCVCVNSSHRPGTPVVVWQHTIRRVASQTNLVAISLLMTPERAFYVIASHMRYVGVTDW